MFAGPDKLSCYQVNRNVDENPPDVDLANFIGQDTNASHLSKTQQVSSFTSMIEIAPLHGVNYLCSLGEEDIKTFNFKDFSCDLMFQQTSRIQKYSNYLDEMTFEDSKLSSVDVIDDGLPDFVIG
jgi:hypothetical protein